jgi:hypothetical protein
MESLEGMTCGVDNHDPECLCDVVIREVTPINIHAVQGMWMGQEVADANGYENWDNPEELLNYLCDVLFLHDCLDFRSRYCADDDDNHEGLRPFQLWAKVRDSVLQRMAPEGATIRAVLESLGYTAEQFSRASTMGRYSFTMDELEQFESQVMGAPCADRILAGKFGITKSSAHNLKKYWPNRPTSGVYRGQGQHPYQLRMRELIALGKRPKEIVGILADEFGVTLTRSAVSAVKRRTSDIRSP